MCVIIFFLQEWLHHKFYEKMFNIFIYVIIEIKNQISDKQYAFHAHTINW